jgi:hypothetical protein
MSLETMTEETRLALQACAEKDGISPELFLAALKIESNGPTRVVTKVSGGHVAYACPPSQAAEKGIVPDFFLIRNDGWSLGYRAKDRKAALKLWDGEWVYEGKFT